VLQALYYCIPFRKEVLKHYQISVLALQDPSKSQTPPKQSLLSTLGKVFNEIHTNKKQNGVNQPKDFISTLRKENSTIKPQFPSISLEIQLNLTGVGLVCCRTLSWWHASRCS
jgi:hypothetical protein